MSLLVVILAVIGIGTGGYMLKSYRDKEMAGNSIIETPAIYRSGPFQIGVRISPESPVVGDNKLLLLIRDGSGKPVSDVKLKTFAQMPAMGLCPPCVHRQIHRKYPRENMKEPSTCP